QGVGLTLGLVAPPRRRRGRRGHLLNKAVIDERLYDLGGCSALEVGRHQDDAVLLGCLGEKQQLRVGEFHVGSSVVGDGRGAVTTATPQRRSRRRGGIPRARSLGNADTSALFRSEVQSAIDNLLACIGRCRSQKDRTPVSNDPCCLSGSSIRA